MGNPDIRLVTDRVDTLTLQKRSDNKVSSSVIQIPPVILPNLKPGFLNSTRPVVITPRPTSNTQPKTNCSPSYKDQLDLQPFM
jgi:hypothetical protein